MNITIYYNPEKLLDQAGKGWVWDILFSIILIGLAISFVVEIFKIQKQQSPDFFGVVWKTIIIILLYKFLPSTLERTMNFVNTTIPSEKLDKVFYAAFSKYSANLIRTSVDAKDIKDGCTAIPDISLMNSGIYFFSSYMFQYFLKITVFVSLAAVWVIKKVVFSWMWPVFMSLNTIGLCTGLAVPAFPGQGFSSLGTFFRSLAAFSLWPVLYSSFIFIAGEPLSIVMTTASSALKCPSGFEPGPEVISVLSGTFFMGFTIAAIPFISKRLVYSTGTSRAVAGTSNTIGKILTSTGTKLSESAGSGSIVGKIGTSIAGGGQKLINYTESVSTEKVETVIKSQTETQTKNEINQYRELRGSKNEKD
jgi:hypothetical protein